MKNQTFQFWLCVLITTGITLLFAMSLNAFVEDEELETLTIVLDKEKMPALKAAADDLGVKSFETSEDADKFFYSWGGFLLLFFINAVVISIYVVFDNFFDKIKARKAEEAS